MDTIQRLYLEALALQNSHNALSNCMTYCSIFGERNTYLSETQRKSIPQFQGKRLKGQTIYNRLMFLLLNSLVTEAQLCKNSTRAFVKQDKNFGQITHLKPLFWHCSISSLKNCTVNSILETSTKSQPNNWMKGNIPYYPALTKENVSLPSVFFPTFFMCFHNKRFKLRGGSK